MQLKAKPQRLDNRRHQQKLLLLVTPTTQNHPLFPVGSQVEVSSDEEGFRGAWYLATVIQPPTSSSFSSSSSSSSISSSKQRIFVEYQSLLADENGSALLREFVDVEFVRPNPPVDEGDKVCFQVNDIVDAYFQDGWWCGVVNEVVSETKYWVSFSNPPDEMEFESSNLRVHKDWVDGKWVLPEKLRMRELNFSLGTVVEVNIDPDNSHDVWFPATFIKQVTNNSFVVEYKSSNEAGLRKVTVDSLHIRPSPPCSTNKAFNLLEKVDAFYDFRWLSGVVTKILADGRYIVYFKRTKKEKELCHADLRPHMEWTNGKWVHSSQDTSMSSNSAKHSGHAVNGGDKEKICAPSEGSGAVKDNIGEDRVSTVTLKSCQKELKMPGSGKANYNSRTFSNKRIKQTSANGDTIYSRPSRRLNEEPASNVPLCPETFKSKTKKMGGSNSRTSGDLDSLTPDHPGQSSLKQSNDSNQPSDPTEIKGDYEKHPVTRKRGRPPKPQAVVPDTIDQTPNNSDVVRPLGAIVIGLTHNGKMIDSLGESSSRHLKVEKKAVEDKEKSLDTSADHESVGSEQQKESEITNLKRKRGRPPKILFRLSSPKTKETVSELVKEKKDDVSDVQDKAERHSSMNEVEKAVAGDSPDISDSAPSTDSRRRHARIISDQIKRLSDVRRLNTRSAVKRQVRKYRKFPAETVVSEKIEPAKPVMLRRGRKQKSTKQAEPLIEDVVGNSRERAIEVLDDVVAGDGERAVAVTSSTASDDDKPLSTWFEGTHSPPANDGKVLVGTAGQCDEVGEGRDGNKTPPVGRPKEKGQEKTDEYSSGEDVSQDKDVPDRPEELPIQSQCTAIVPVDEGELPFVKNSLIWEMIESMEVLKRIPQKPHFRPLYNCKEECREGLAIGNMVTFTSLVERISRARFADPKSLLDGYLEALVDLEELGFDVAPVRDQLNRLISIKGGYEQAQNTSKEIESQIMERNHEKSKVNEEIADLDKKIAELKEKRALAVSQIERKDAEITLLKSSVDAVKGALESAREEFEKVTASLW